MKQKTLRVLTCLWMAAVFYMGSFAAYSENDISSTTAEAFEAAQAAYQEKSWAQAAQLYAQISPEGLPAETARWLTFRQNASTLNNLLSSSKSDPKEINNLRSEIIKMLTADPSKAKDAFWAEVTEYLGDSYLEFPTFDRRNVDPGSQYYFQALDYWAGSTDLSLAQERYMEIVWKCVTFHDRSKSTYFFQNPSYIPKQILQNAIKIARNRGEEDRMHILLATFYKSQMSGPDIHFLVESEYQKVLQAETSTPWYDMALFQYAQWLENRGKVVWLSEGNYSYEPDYEKALAVYKKLIQTFKKEDSVYVKPATQAIENITTPQIQAYVSNFFLPASSVEFSLNYRNIDQLNLALYPLQLSQDIAPAEDPLNASTFLKSVKLDGKTPVYQTLIDSTPKNSYASTSTNITLQSDLTSGAYLLEASGAGKSSRQLVLVTDMGIIFKHSPQGENLTYVCNALSGEPIANAEVTLISRYKDNEQWKSETFKAQTDASGLARLNLSPSVTAYQYGLLCASKGSQQALLFLGMNQRGIQESERFSFYVFTDRPAYRPQEKVEWKSVVRSYQGDQMKTPSGVPFTYSITDPKGAKVKEGAFTLNDFGSAMDSLELTEQMTLGEYSIQFYNKGSTNALAAAALFRLEEYKLPEYKVSISAGSAQGIAAQSFRVGDPITATLQAEYFFGGPVVNATVSIEVRKKEYYHIWNKERQYPWLYTELDRNYNGYYWMQNPGEIVHTQTLTTDALGQAKITIETPRDARGDLEYIFTARLTDASRREVTGQGSVKVTRQSYYVRLEPQKNIFAPGEDAFLKIQAQDANGFPRSVEGALNVKRKFWVEKWISPANKLIEGEELEKWKTSVGRENFPPPQEPGKKPWRLSFNGYQFEEVFSEKITTSEDGKAEVHFKVDKPGCYTIAWAGDDFILLDNGEKIPWSPIKSETMLWAANENTKTLQTRNQGIQIILNQDTAHLGQPLTVMIQTEHPSRYVLLTAEAEALLHTQVVKINGDTKLIEVPISDAFCPNFWLSASLMNQAQVYQNDVQVIVPPEKNFITLELTPSATTEEPRSTGKIKVKTLDTQGKPVAAEVALGVADESVYTIQEEYAKDPREFFYGKMHDRTILTPNSLWLPLVLLTPQNKDEGVEMYSEEMASDSSIGGGVLRYKSARVGRSAIAYSAAPAARLMGINLSENAPAPDPDNLVSESVTGGVGGGIGEAGGLSESQVVVRNDFRSTILWEPTLQTDADGCAEVQLTYPDNLTAWRISARAQSRGNLFGYQRSEVKVTQPLMARLQAPRFFTTGDQLTLSAIVNNNSNEELSITSRLTTEPANLLALKTPQELSITLGAGEEKRLDWQVQALNPGEVKIQVMARSENFADAMEKTYPIYEHGIEKQISRSGKLSGTEALVSIELPQERKSTSMEITLTPCLAAAMLDALPYLFDYPYECTEQTMSRFLPAVLVIRTLQELGLKAEDIEARLFAAGIPGKADSQTLERKPLAQLDKITQKSLERLYDFQHSDGGWGWWKEGDSDDLMSAYVVWGMALAQEAGLSVNTEVYQKGILWLDENLVQNTKEWDTQAWMLHALTCTGQKTDTKHRLAVFENLYKNRNTLNPTSRALLTLCASQLGFKEEAAVLGRNLENGVIRDEKPSETILFKQADSSQTQSQDLVTAHWGQSGIFARWSEGDVLASALSLSALLNAAPESNLIDPAVNWLLKNRHESHWNNTLETSISLMALCEFIKQSGEPLQEVQYALEVNGSPVDSRILTPEQFISAPTKLWVDATLLREGKNEIKISKLTGSAAIYFSVTARYFSLEEPISAAGNEVFATRQYYKLSQIPTLLQGPATRKTLLKPGDRIESGDRIEALLTLENKNHYQYLVFEDIKPAGFETVSQKSGTTLYARQLSKQGIERRALQASALKKDGLVAPDTTSQDDEVNRRPAPWLSISEDEDYTGLTAWVYLENRDRKTALFIHQLPEEGVWEIRLPYRAEIPGQFHGLPVIGQAMYVPLLRCNSSEEIISIQEKVEP